MTVSSGMHLIDLIFPLVSTYGLMGSPEQNRLRCLTGLTVQVAVQLCCIAMCYHAVANQSFVKSMTLLNHQYS